MKLFLMRSDENYKYYCFEEYSANFLEESPTGEFSASPQIKLSLFKGKTKKEKSLNEEFSATTISIFHLFVNHEIKQQLQHLEGIEFFQADTDNGKAFFYLNVKNKLELIEFHSKEDLYEMAMNNKYKFKNNADLENILFFRDNNMPYNIFFTELFVERYAHLFKGVDFVEVNE